jgi:uncharacterized membrane protein
VWAEAWASRFSFLAFAVGFAVIGACWVAHNRLFSHIERFDVRLIWFNLLAPSFVVIMPFTTSLVGEHGDAQISVVIYALPVALAGFAPTGMAACALLGHRLCADAPAALSSLPEDLMRSPAVMSARVTVARSPSAVRS